MKKSYRYKKRNKYSAPEPERRSDIKTENFKYLLFMLAFAVIAVGVYVTSVQLEFMPTLYIYFGGAIVCFLVFFFLNGGIAPRKIENIEKPIEMGYDEFSAYLEKLRVNRHRAKYFLAVFLPLLLCLVGDYLITYWGGKMAK